MSAYPMPQVEGASYVDRYAASVAIALEADTPALWGIESANGYLPGYSRRLLTLNAQGREWFARYVGLFNTRYLTVSPSGLSELGLLHLVVASDPATRTLLAEDPGALPRAYLARPRCLGSDEAVMKGLGAGNFDLSREVLLPCTPSSEPPASTAGPRGRAQMMRYRPEELLVSVTSDQPAALVVGDAFYAGWTARVDGNEQPLLPANYGGRAVLVSEGSHQVELRFRAPHFRLAAWTSLLGALAGLLAIVAEGVMRRRRPVSPL
jgi:hypothetical protein